MNSALITQRTHKPPHPRFHRQWIEYAAIATAARQRRDAKQARPEGRQSGGEAVSPKRRSNVR